MNQTISVHKFVFLFYFSFLFADFYLISFFLNDGAHCYCAH